MRYATFGTVTFYRNCEVGHETQERMGARVSADSLLHNEIGTLQAGSTVFTKPKF